MKLRAILCIVIWLAAGLAATVRASDLSVRIQTRLQKVGGHWGVYLHDLAGGRRLLKIAARDRFHAASSMKLFVLAKVMADVQGGRYQLGTAVAVHDRFQSTEPGAGRFSVKPKRKEVRAAIGATLPVSELVHWMIRESDNLASNLLIERAGGPDEVTRFMRAQGLRQSDVRRYLMDLRAYAAGRSNMAVPEEYCGFLARLYRGEVVNQDTSRRIRESLAAVAPGWVGRRLPHNVRIEHKPGRINGVRNDAGLYLLPDGQAYALCVMGGDIADGRGAEKAIGDVSYMVWQAMVHGRPKKIR